MKNNMENLEMVVKEAGLDLFKGSDLLKEKDMIPNNTNFINISTKETIELVDGSFVNEEGWCCYLVDIGDEYFINARQFLLTTFSDTELMNEYYRRQNIKLKEILGINTPDAAAYIDEVTTGVDIDEVTTGVDIDE